MFRIKGVFKRRIFSSSDTGYVIGLFKVKESDMENLQQKTITIVGYFHELTEEETYVMHGDLVEHERYGQQFKVELYEKPLPEEKDSIVEFLSSGLFKGIGEKTAQKIVDILGKDTLTVILENPDNLLLIPGLTAKQIKTLHEKLSDYQASYEIILKLNDLGFSTKDSMLIYNKYREKTSFLIEDNIYQVYYDSLKIPFKKIDSIALKSGMAQDDRKRVGAIIIYAFREVCATFGHSYLTKEELYSYSVRASGFDLSTNLFLESLFDLEKNMLLIEEEGRLYLKEMHEDEVNIVKRVCYLTRKEEATYKYLERDIGALEKHYDIFYNEEQRKAILESYKKNFLVITGGPGTGKTTIIKGIVNLYKEIYKLKSEDLEKKLALLAPTGRASKRLTESTLVHASTIHRFLKWNKESDSFQINERCKSDVEFVIVDEASMVDVSLFSSLLKGLKTDTKIILVGDFNQLPSVGAGQLLKDIIESGVVPVVSLTKLYRQSMESNIIRLAYDINQDAIDPSIFNLTDANFIPCSSINIKKNILDVVKEQENRKNFDYQVLAPMYRGVNGIDSINLTMQEEFNKKSTKKNEIVINGVVFREQDKVIQLTNMPEDNVFNGDIGVIEKIKSTPKKEVIIDFDGNIVVYTPSDFSNFKHAYAISIHKSQGSEFNTIIIPLSKEYGKMLYRKLIYTGVTRAKKNLYLIGDLDALFMASSNNHVDIRHTTIRDRLISKM